MLKSLLASIARKRPAAGPGDFGAAVAHFHAGRLGEADELAHRILRRDPDHAEAWNLLGAIALARGEQSAAARHFEDAAALAPLDAGIITNLAETKRRNGDLDGAEALSRQALAIDPRRVPALHTLVLTLKAQGRGAEAFEYCQLLLSLDPDFGPGREAYLFLLQLTDVLEPLQVAAEHCRLARRIEVPARWRSLRHANTPDPERRLRIGYVSADFFQHAASYFIEPVLSGHDGRGFDVICYAGVKRPDEITDRLRQSVGTWRDVLGLDDERLAELIFDDAVDILVDLSGHTAGNRMPVFARKPAPLQLTWFGYPGTTGLESIDYKITDAICDPPGMSDTLYAERLLRLPDVLYCYQPPADMPEVVELPALRNGYVTFGGMNDAAKLNPQWIALWAGLLAEVPRSRLVLASVPAGATRDRLCGMFSQHGVDPARIAIHDRMPYDKFWELHHDVDVALDTYPCNGGTTTCETVWLGVPVVTFAGSRFGGNRLGTSMLASLGLHELIARTQDDYLAIARGLAADLSRLAALRRDLRTRMRASPLTDRDRFMRNLERAYRGIWREWCARRRR
ncbi:MAG: tetratricopeptide repeat protein [Betaproteobacteria bacterium]|nr:tetratricopeptide repeat protein [Betaproteobacteria bacterium]